MIIYLARKAQIYFLLVEKIIFHAEYLNFADFFLEKLAKVLLKLTKTNEHTIKFEKCKLLTYKPIYSIESVEFKIVKTYINTNLTNAFIRLLKLPASDLILFVQKLNVKFCLCVNYLGFNILIFKNQ